VTKFALPRLLRIPGNVEAFGLSTLYVVLTVCYLGAVLPWWAAVLLTPIAMQIPMYISGAIVLPLGRNNLNVNSRLMMTLLVAASLAVRSPLAWAFLALVAANALAAMTMRRLILGFAAAAPLIAIAIWPHWLIGLGIVVLSHLLILYPTLVPNSQWLGPVVTCFETDRKEVWLTIDDGPADDTEAIVQMLERRKAKATFFEIAKNHSMTHPSATFWCLGPRRIAAEIGNNRWFRAPVGMKNPFVHPALAKRNMRLIGWSVRGLDALGRDVERVVRRVMRGVRPGAIVVLHQGRPTSLQTIERVVEELQARGYELVIPDDARLKTKR
jgi:peptidoglycan/xylan/chitin deacetylase (PgdA/CDA1 family)